jgi:hypothetical protein
MSEIINTAKAIREYRNSLRNLVRSTNNERLVYQANTGTLINNQTANLLIYDTPKSYTVLSVYANTSAWVRLYTSESKRNLDIGRSITSDPESNAGVVLEVITANAEAILVSPGVNGYNSDSNTTIPLKVTNRSGGNASIQIELTLVALEE